MNYMNFSLSKEEMLYADMCKKAKKLQEMWCPRIGDKCIDMEDLVLISNKKQLDYISSVKENVIWLPTEENVQAILYAPTMERPIDLLYRFSMWVNGHRGMTDKHTKFHIKHLWLCYMMFHLYNLTWVDDNWRKINYRSMI